MSEFESHWVHHSFSLVPHQSKELHNLLYLGESKVLQNFDMWPKQFKLWLLSWCVNVCYASPHMWFDSCTDEHLRSSNSGTYALQVEQGHNAMEVTKNICCTKGEDVVDHCTVSRWFKKFYSGCKNLNNQTTSGTPKTMVSKTETNLVNSPQRLSGELCISQSQMACYLHHFSKSIHSCC